MGSWRAIQSGFLLIVSLVVVGMATTTTTYYYYIMVVEGPTRPRQAPDYKIHIEGTQELHLDIHHRLHILLYRPAVLDGRCTITPTMRGKHVKG